ncbi:MAG: UDP-glucose--hexose-1-phosphate uridylyltransferase [Ardenticatenaceae bacterium]|nr:UDP-glucose--hexose-1-phosphate uridylyltransferase [Ardenticatenaceae bacterium]HBY97389.1 galactose-1-phosphate uridylyltransferase [Chloroflexota bacterium]
MDRFNPEEHPHRRLNPLTGAYVVVSPHRMKRPWQGQVEKLPPDVLPAYDPTCYLCPGNERAGGARNPSYSSTFVFDNDFAGVLPDTPPGEFRVDDLLLAESERGIARVLCFSPRHDLTLPVMSTAEIRAVVDAWIQQTEVLGAIPWIRHVQLFENRGAMMGASNPHPHGQIWATEHLPDEPARELVGQRNFWQAHNRCLLCAYLELELARGERLVCENEHFVVLVPFWAVWPFETMVLPRRHVPNLPALQPAERDELAGIVRRLGIRYDNLFETSFPYSMGWHQQPMDEQSYPEWHLHAHYFPPLLRSATIRKFMVGFEMLGTPQRDLTPERAAERLRALSEIHSKREGSA